MNPIVVTVNLNQNFVDLISLPFKLHNLHLLLSVTPLIETVILLTVTPLEIPLVETPLIKTPLAKTPQDKLLSLVIQIDMARSMLVSYQPLFCPLRVKTLLSIQPILPTHIMTNRRLTIQNPSKTLIKNPIKTRLSIILVKNLLIIIPTITPLINPTPK
jgi:hypothetical protein